MAIKFPLANGNWSDATNWNDGTLPDVGDDVHADGKTVTIDQDVTVLSIRNDQRSGGTANGGFNFATTLTTYNITADLFGFNATLMNLNQGSRTYNFIGNVESILGATASVYCITTTSLSNTINVIGNINAIGNGSFRSGIFINGTSTILNIIGNISSGSANGGGAIYGIQASSVATVTITGNVTTNGNNTISSNISQHIAIIFNGTINFNITGNILTNTVQNGGTCMYINSNNNSINIEGNVIAKHNLNANLGAIIIASSPNTIRINKIIGSDNGTGVAVYNLTNSNVIVKEFEFSPIGTCPAIGKVLIDNTVFSVSARNENLETVIYTEDNNVLNYIPQEEDVREDITYYDGLKTGSLIMPDPANVRKGVATDNTVGTADLTAEDILNAILTSENPVAERLRNVSTVQTTGSQLQAYLDQ
jgi:hypothetical protein